MESLIIAAVTGVVSSVATIAAIKVEISWLKHIQSEIKSQVLGLEERLTKLEANKVQSSFLSK